MSDQIAILVSQAAGPFTFLTVDKAMNCHYHRPNDAHGARSGNFTPFSIKRAEKISGDEELTVGDISFTGKRLSVKSIDHYGLNFTIQTRHDHGFIEWRVEDIHEVWLVNLDKIHMHGEARVEQTLCEIDQHVFSSDKSGSLVEGCKAVESLIDDMKSQLERFKTQCEQTKFLENAPASFSFSRGFDGELTLVMNGTVARATNMAVSRKLLNAMKAGIEKFLVKRHLTAKQKQLEEELAKVTDQLKG